MRKNNLWKRGIAVAVASVMLFSLAACGNSAGKTSEETKQDEQIETNAEKVLNVGVSVIKDVPFNPCMFGTNGEQFVPLYDSLIALEDGKFVPCLAKEWNLSEDKT